ncbi:MAG: exo-alpha-sialidase [Oscillochloridaceae bacterium]|nr:exo-alpha-sialidase [Chloroflexaceae bacterium]MDW8389810.1 exo-alpha-sialidase [Oscillochloridaceae bacterium]
MTDQPNRRFIIFARPGAAPRNALRSLRPILPVFLLGMLLLGVAGAGRPAFASSGWSILFDISDDRFGWFPDIAADNQGAIHVIWGSGDLGASLDPNDPDLSSRDLLRYRVLRDGQWSPMNDIAFTCVGGYTVRNSIIATSDGYLHVLFRGCTDVNAVRAPAEQAWSAGAWTRPWRLGSSYYNAIAADSKGVLHAFYNEGLSGTEEGNRLLSEIFYRRSTDGGQTWTVRANLSQLPGGDERMQVKVDGRDRVHLVWDHGSDWYLGLDQPNVGVYRRSDDGGKTWRDPVFFSAADGPVVQTTLGLAGDNPIVVYRSAIGTTVYYQSSNDGGTTWNPPQIIPGVRARDPEERGLDSYAMATDSAGRVHLVMPGFLEESITPIPMLLHLSWNGQSWSTPEIVSATANRPMWPRLAIARGNQLHAVWFSYTDASGWGERRVLHSSITVDAPALSPTPFTTPPAGPGALGSPLPGSPDGPATPIPRQPPAPSALPDEIRTIPPPSVISGTNPLFIYGLALVPVIGLVIILVTLTLWRRSRNR